MSHERCFSVAVIGIPLHEQSVLKLVFRPSAQRSWAYALTPLDETNPPDILLVDLDKEDAVSEWHERCEHDEVIAKTPTVRVSRSELAAEPHTYYLQRPLMVSRVIDTLDQIVEQELAATFAQAVATHKALVVDDSLPMRKQIALELERFGVKSDCAESAEQAIEFLQVNSTYSIIFLDVILPGVDGYVLCKNIKRDPSRKQIPIVMLTGRGSAFDRVRGKLAGCNTYLTKPVASEELAEVVKKHLGQLLSDDLAIF